MNTTPSEAGKRAGLYCMLPLVVSLVFLLQDRGGSQSREAATAGSGEGARAYLSTADSLSCCYSLAYDYEPIGGRATLIEVKLLTADAYFSAIQFPLGSGWNYYVSDPGRRLLWQYAGELPAGNQPLFDFCLDPPASALPVEMAVNWLSNGQVISSDTLQMACHQCMAPQEEKVECQGEGGYAYSFGLANLTEYTIHQLRITEPAGQDFIEEETVELSEPWPPGTFAGGFRLKLRPQAEEAEKICFELTGSRLLENGSALDCCTFTRCLELPFCDRCCTPFEVYEANVNSGFTVSIDCERGFLSALYQAWSPCDQVSWVLRNLNTGTDISGSLNADNIAFAFTDEVTYELCMEVERRNAGLMNCYGDTTLTVCDTLFFDCQAPSCVDDSLIDWAFDCPPEIELVCGCDSMTYINDCAALNWSGITDWRPGPCKGPPIDNIKLEIIAFSAEQALLRWLSLEGLDYRYFLVQRLLTVGGWATIGQVSGNTFTFTDTAPGEQNRYRVVGVIWPGKPAFSNTVQAFLTAYRQEEGPEAGRLWPNPSRHRAYLRLPWAGAAEVVIYDGGGRLIGNWHWPASRSKKMEITVAHWPAGLYFLRARGPTGESWSTKLLISP